MGDFLLSRSFRNFLGVGWFLASFLNMFGMVANYGDLGATVTHGVLAVLCAMLGHFFWPKDLEG